MVIFYLVQRSDLALEELVETAEGICGNDQRLLDCLRDVFRPAALAYQELCQHLTNKKEFFGLRDFYSFIKMLVYFSKRSTYNRLNFEELKYAVRRNFDGFSKENVDPVQIFKKFLNTKLGVGQSNLIPEDGCSSIGI